MWAEAVDKTFLNRFFILADWNCGWISATTSISKTFLSLTLSCPSFQLWKDYEIATAWHREKSLLFFLSFKQAVDKTSFQPAVGGYLGAEREEETAVRAAVQKGLNWAWQHLHHGFSTHMVLCRLGPGNIVAPICIRITFDWNGFNLWKIVCFFLNRS